MTNNKKGIRINKELENVLAEVPKNVSYADWLLDKLYRLESHEKTAKYCIIQKEYIGNNKLSINNRYGISPLRWLTLSIENEPDPKINNIPDYKQSSIGKFATEESAIFYVEHILKGRKLQGGKSNEYTLAKYDNYELVEDFLRHESFDFGSRSVDDFAGEATLWAMDQNIGLIGDISEYIIKEYEKHVDEIEGND